MLAAGSEVIARWRAMSLAARAASTAVVALVVLNVLAMIAEATGGEQGDGPPSSSLSMGDDGLAAYASLLEHYGRPLQRLTSPLAAADLDPDATLVALDPEQLAPQEVERLRDFAAAGGRLLLGGASLAPSELVVDDPPPGSPVRAAPVPPALAGAEPRDVARVRTAGEGSWMAATGSAASDSEEARLLLVARDLGAGEVLLLADPSPLQNRLLDEADNAGFGLQLAGPDDGPVIFAESLHGYGAERGVAALPGRWVLAITLICLAAVLWLWAQARRLGEPDGRRILAPPPRRDYVEAVGGLLSRTGDGGALADLLQARAEDAVAQRGGAPPESAEALAAAAVSRGADPKDAAALAAPDGTKEQLLGASRALAAITKTSAAAKEGNW